MVAHVLGHNQPGRISYFHLYTFDPHAPLIKGLKGGLTIGL